MSSARLDQQNLPFAWHFMSVPGLPRAIWFYEYIKFFGREPVPTATDQRLALLYCAANCLGA